MFSGWSFKRRWYVEQPLLKSEDSIKRIIDEKGQYAKTYYHILEQRENQTLVECELVTGRTHQIRVHMASLHHPLTGDVLYGSKEGNFYLESVQISFIHPYTKEKILFKK